MRTLPLWLLLASAAGCTVYCLLDPGPAGPEPADVTCRQLADAPGLHAGHAVRLSTAGAEVEKDRLVYRRMASDPPAVVVVFPGPVPDPVPRQVVGDCRAPIVPGAPVVVNVR